MLHKLRISHLQTHVDNRLAGGERRRRSKVCWSKGENAASSTHLVHGTLFETCVPDTDEHETEDTIQQAHVVFLASFVCSRALANLLLDKHVPHGPCTQTRVGRDGRNSERLRGAAARSGSTEGGLHLYEHPTSTFMVMGVLR